MTKPARSFPKQEFLDLIRSGMTEPRALKTVNSDITALQFLMIRDGKFKEDIAEAKKARADVFYEKIVDSVEVVLEKEEVPAAKLRIDTLKYLASIDNPEKYSEKIKHQHDVNINIFQEIKDLPQSEVRKLITDSDPFIVDAEFSDVDGDDDLEDLL